MKCFTCGGLATAKLREIGNIDGGTWTYYYCKKHAIITRREIEANAAAHPRGVDRTETIG